MVSLLKEMAHTILQYIIEGILEPPATGLLVPKVPSKMQRIQETIIQLDRQQQQRRATPKITMLLRKKARQETPTTIQFIRKSPLLQLSTQEEPALARTPLS